MKFIGDFHIHSHFSVATSKQLDPEHLDHWGRIKGIKVIGTGDFTHPGWMKELKEKLEPSEQGLFRLRDEYRLECPLPPSPEREVRFLLSSEISNIYKKNGKVRKVHNVIFAPDFKTVEKIQGALTAIGGNITSDGRPILGLDSRDLLEIALEANDRIFFIPAHIWTPWFSALGSKSGFDSIDECYGDLSEHIHAVETGLSTDPPMHWMCRFLDRFTLVSNSDAHSPEKLGRNANRFNTEVSYDAIVDAVKSGDPERFLGTIDLFPQEGKYHYDGHRKCGVVWDPLMTLKNNGRCPVCGKKVTIGVMNRVAQLADRRDLSDRPNRLPFVSIIPLKEILSEMENSGPGTKKVARIYNELVVKAGSEMDLLLKLPCEEIASLSDHRMSEAIRRMRNREVIIREGYDGEFGRICVFHDGEEALFDSEPTLFGDEIPVKPPSRREMVNFDVAEYQRLRDSLFPERAVSEESVEYGPAGKLRHGLNKTQREAAEYVKGPSLIVSGPGSGKTRTIAYRIANLIRNKKVRPDHILAVTFTNKAARELGERVQGLLGKKAGGLFPSVMTFHAFGLSLIERYPQYIEREKGFWLIDEEDKRRIFIKTLKCEKKECAAFSEAVTRAKQNLCGPEDAGDPKFAAMYRKYESVLKELNALDLDDLLYKMVRMLVDHPDVLTETRERFQWIMIDEYQDVNQSQYSLVRLLAPGGKANLCVIGDPNQAIYGFRGADAGFIRRFLEDYPAAVEFRLNKSYRCSNRILRASEGMLSSNRESVALEGLRKGVKIRIVQIPTDKSEAEFVARTIENMIGGTRFFSIDSDVTGGRGDAEISSLSDFAVLFRIGRQSAALEKAFADHGIPCQLVDATPFFKREPVRSVIDLLKLTLNPDNAFLRKKLEERKILSSMDRALYGCRVPGRKISGEIADMIDQYFSELKEKHAAEFERLLDLAGEFGSSLEEFLKYAALGTGQDALSSGQESVPLMTLHAAKGLEFRCVFVVGCEDGLLPYSLFENQKSDPAEERRLLYVGMTRAKKYLFLTHAGRRMIMGKRLALPRSPFLDAIERDLIDYKKSGFRKKGKGDPQLKLF